jgi:hypothetical protein
MHSLIIFIAITIHKSSECFAFTVHIRKRVTKIKLHAPLVIGFIILTPMAILLGTTGLHYFATVNSMLPLIHLLSAAILFYIAITHNLIHVLHDATHRMLLLALFCFSAILVGSLALVV